mmetsp:Transcript_60562/g.108003  ORF Transcript_60562/g.108003 Transcript_60562/m.108003 type:complete len:113 (-) Transcript_60562:594-932(-)
MAWNGLGDLKEPPSGSLLALKPAFGTVWTVKMPQNVWKGQKCIGLCPRTKGCSKQTSKGGSSASVMSGCWSAPACIAQSQVLVHFRAWVEEFPQCSAVYFVCPAMPPSFWQI